MIIYYCAGLSQVILLFPNGAYGTVPGFSAASSRRRSSNSGRKKIDESLGWFMAAVAGLRQLPGWSLEIRFNLANLFFCRIAFRDIFFSAK